MSELNQYGEVIEEVWERSKLPPFLYWNKFSQEERNELSERTVMNYYRSKPPDKLSDFERKCLGVQA